MQIFGLIEIIIIPLTRKEKVRRYLKKHGKIKTIKMYKDRYKCGLNEAWEFIKGIEDGEPNE